MAPSSPPLEFPKTLKPRFVWTKRQTVAKVVDLNELAMWERMCHIDGIPPVLGTFEITSVPNTGQLLVLSPHSGQCCLTSFPSSGIPNHVIDEGNVLTDGKDIFLVDRDKALEAVGYKLRRSCPDLPFLVEPQEIGEMLLANNPTADEEDAVHKRTTPT